MGVHVFPILNPLAPPSPSHPWIIPVHRPGAPILISIPCDLLLPTRTTFLEVKRRQVPNSEWNLPFTPLNENLQITWLLSKCFFLAFCQLTMSVSKQQNTQWFKQIQFQRKKLVLVVTYYLSVRRLISLHFSGLSVCFISWWQEDCSASKYCSLIQG